MLVERDPEIDTLKEPVARNSLSTSQVVKILADRSLARSKRKSHS
jgi:hypothetical protein